MAVEREKRRQRDFPIITETGKNVDNLQEKRETLLANEGQRLKNAETPPPLVNATQLHYYGSLNTG